jgi:hypothetical protein
MKERNRKRRKELKKRDKGREQQLNGEEIKRKFQRKAINRGGEQITERENKTKRRNV